MDGLHFELRVVHDLSEDLAKYTELVSELGDCVLELPKRKILAQLTEVRGRILENITHLNDGVLEAIGNAIAEEVS